MTLTEHKIWRLPLLILVLWLGACSMQYEDIVQPEFVAPGDLTLLVNVHTGDRNVKATRGYDNNDGVAFEPTTLDREKINTLRVIIVRNTDGLIVHNDYRDLRSPSIVVNNLKYRVEYATEYTVYLIGNETGLPTDKQNLLKGEKFEAGKTYPADATETLEEIQIGATVAGNPMIMGQSTLVPMTEFFTVKTMTEAEAETLKKPDSEGVIQNETFFITRAASKFSFYFFRADDFEVEEGDSWTINKIKISGLGQSEYLFPKETEYFPSKSSDRTSINRDIKEFEIPRPESGNFQTGEWEFSFPNGKVLNVGELPVKKGVDPTSGLTSDQLEKCQLIPELYFPESKGYNYRGSDDSDTEYNFGCTISFDGSTYLDEVKLPNLPYALPRNTHVVVIVTIHDRYITATVDVIPFSEVKLEPDYGLEREEFTGYVVGKDSSGRKCWYEGNYYDPQKAVPLYLGPSDAIGDPVSIEGKDYMLVYSDFERTAAGLSRIIERYYDDEGKEAFKTHVVTPQGITGYQLMKDMDGWDMYVNDMKQRVWLDEDWLIKCYRTLNEWDRLTFAQCTWGEADKYPKAWFDVLGNRYLWSEGTTKEQRKAALIDKIGEGWLKYLED